MKTVLLQESDQKANAAASRLRGEGCQVSRFHTEDDAVAWLTEALVVDLIVMDIDRDHYPRRRILDLLQSHSRLRGVPVITCASLERSAGVTPADDPDAQPLPSLLVVDDEQVLLSLLTRVLSRGGYNTAQATCCDDAVSVLNDGEIGFILSDIDMPEKTGLDLLAKVRELDEYIPMLMMTGNGSRYGHRRVLEAGADGYLPKPFRNADLVTLIELMSGHYNLGKTDDATRSQEHARAL